MRHNFKEVDNFNETMTFGEVIRKARRLMGMNQTDFGEWVGLNTVTVSSYETGKHKPSLQLCEEVLDMLGFEIRIVRVNKEAIHEHYYQGI